MASSRQTKLQILNLSIYTLNTVISLQHYTEFWCVQTFVYDWGWLWGRSMHNTFLMLYMNYLMSPQIEQAFLWRGIMPFSTSLAGYIADVLACSNYLILHTYIAKSTTRQKHVTTLNYTSASLNKSHSKKFPAVFGIAKECCLSHNQNPLHWCNPETKAQS